MNELVKIFKTKLRLGKSKNKDDEKTLELDVCHLANVMSSQGETLSKTPVEDFRKIIVYSDTNAKGKKKFPANGSGQKKTDFNSLLQNQRELVDEIGGKQVEIIPCDNQKSFKSDSGRKSFNKKKFFSSNKRSFNIKKYDLPRVYYDVIEKNPESYFDLTSPLTPKNYRERFQKLLWIEEASVAIDLRRYDRNGVKLEKFFRDSYKLRVPGLAEGRPSVLCGDKLMLRTVGPQRQYYEGFVTEVRLKDIIISLHSSLSSRVDDLRFHIYFQINRTPVRRKHFAINNFHNMDLLFPEIKSNLKKTSSTTGIDKSNIRWFSKDLNIYQKGAIINVLEAKCRPAPYVIFGPPGTGKTVTMVEAILQVYARGQHGKILVCGNSNTCADSLAIRIKKSGVVDLKKMIRIVAYHRMKKNLVPHEIQDMALDMDGVTQQVFDKARIVITTCNQACVLHEFKAKFAHVFIDEAGHADEPETLCAIGLIRSNGCVVLAGDPHQLGPVCMSNIAKYNGLGTSLLERLCKLPVYQRQENHKGEIIYDERYLTKLIISYRSDSRVMEVNDKLFYESELEYVKKTPPEWLSLLHVKTPMLFQSVRGRDGRDFNNPSWFNANEAIMCLSYAKRLYGAGLKSSQLGIITPYRLQIRKLNILFDMCRLEKPKISTIEEFQGDEREVIIITTVRASNQNIKFDEKYKLGFLFNPKLFNVAVSRAKWLVIALGDPDILARDSCWVKYMDTAQKVLAY